MRGTTYYSYQHYQWLLKTAIAQTIGKDKSTVGKEIKLHRSLPHKCKMPLECNNYRKCPYGIRCTPDCPDCEPFKCSRIDRTLGACYGCSNWSKCRFDKYTYCPEDAQMDCRSVLIDSRQGVNLTTSDTKAITDTDFMYHDLFEKLEAFGLHKIEKDKVVLKPYLLKK